MSGLLPTGIGHPLGDCACCSTVDPFVAAMSSGNGVHVTAADLAGNQLWTYQLDAGDITAAGGRVAIDSVGNVYCLWYAGFITGGGDLYVTSLTPAGALRWSTKVGENSSLSSDRIGSIDVDANDNIFAGFYDLTPAPDNSGALLDSAGNIVWDFATQTGGYRVNGLPTMVRFIPLATEYWLCEDVLDPSGTPSYPAARFDLDGTFLDDTAIGSVNFDVDQSDNLFFPGGAGSNGATFLTKRDSVSEASDWTATPATTINSASLTPWQSRWFDGNIHVPFEKIAGGSGTYNGKSWNFIVLIDNGGTFSISRVQEAQGGNDHLYACDASGSGIFAGGELGKLYKVGGDMAMAEWSLTLPGTSPKCYGVAIYPNRWA